MTCAVQRSPIMALDAQTAGLDSVDPLSLFEPEPADPTHPPPDEPQPKISAADDTVVAVTVHVETLDLSQSDVPVGGPQRAPTTSCADDPHLRQYARLLTQLQQRVAETTDIYQTRLARLI